MTHQPAPQPQQAFTGQARPVGQATRLSVVVDNDNRLSEAEKTAHAINAADNPVIIVADNHAETYGAQAAQFHDAFRNCAIVFESDRGAEQFYREAKSLGYYVHHQQIGVLSQHKDKDAETHPAFMQADHIVILGDLYDAYTKEFKTLESQGQNITYSTAPGTPVDLDTIIKGRNEPRDYRPFAMRYKVLGGPK